jgi:hypothetical protein
MRGDTAHDWIRVPLDVSGIAEGTVVSVHLDLRALAADAGLDPGRVVDPRRVSLHHVRPGGEEERPVQFVPDEQDAADPDSAPDRTSWAGGWPADSVPAAAAQTGDLVWTADADREARYRLVLGSPREGQVVQTPSPPRGLRWFGDDGRTSAADAGPWRVRPVTDRLGAVTVERGDDPVARYHVGEDERPHLYPVWGPAGDVRTGYGLPNDPTGGHDHHTSLWVGHRDVGGTNCWERGGDGEVRHESFDRVFAGPVFAGFVERVRWAAPDRPLLSERRRLRVHGDADRRMLDFELLFEPAGEPVTVGPAPFGFLGLRVAPALSVFGGGGEMRNAGGDLNEACAHRERSPWLDIAGPDGRAVALLDHPANPHHPTPWHCRNGGWAGASPAMYEPLTVEEPTRFRYRLLLHDGDDVEARYAAYATEPAVAVGDPRQI